MLWDDAAMYEGAAREAGRKAEFWEDRAREMTVHGRASGDVTSLESVEVSHTEMKDLLEAQGSDPDFLSLEEEE